MVVLSDELEAIAQELVRGEYLDRVHIGLDFFDASINRVAAWVIGARAMLKALLLALLEPTETLRQLEADGDTTARLALLEELKTLPFGAVWDHYCRSCEVPAGRDWLAEEYERDVSRSADCAVQQERESRRLRLGRGVMSKSKSTRRIISQGPESTHCQRGYEIRIVILTLTLNLT